VLWVEQVEVDELAEVEELVEVAAVHLKGLLAVSSVWVGGFLVLIEL